MKHYYIFFGIALAFTVLAGACSSDDSFSSSPDNILSFSTDTVKLDTVFSNVPSAARSFWVYNKTGEGLRCSSVQLRQGSTSGFRVNVDGQYLDSNSDYSVSDIEIRSKDSIRVYVEITSPTMNAIDPQELNDDLVFTLESGVEQSVVLNAWSWDAKLLHNLSVDQDTTITPDGHPIVIYGGITVANGATLTLASGTTLYFHQDAGLDVYGSLDCEGTSEDNVVLRGDRIDRMFDYLPYDRIPGQWQGIHFYSSSFGNNLSFTDIHSTYNGIIADSSSVNQQKLTLDGVVIHNCQGWGLWAQNCKMTLNNTIISNTLNDCLYLEGGDVTLNGCTLAQFYPFDANRGVALFLSDKSPLQAFSMTNSLVTGYADDMLAASRTNETSAFNYEFSYSVLRTPEVTTDDSVYYKNIIFEDPSDTIHGGIKHFQKIDTDNLIYDFSLDSVSSAIGKANPSTALPVDQRGRSRDTQPDAGAYEFIPKN
ncbi:MAG: choice-of-anchor Q domain-containing protein [Prevotella sp.]|jgi:hypothetical protein